MADEPQVVGDWVRERVLGSGGFGIVTLWKNIKTQEQIAIKKCRWYNDNLSSKQKERWTKEVEMMQRINSPNIVSFRKLPPILGKELSKYNPLKLPMLSMEFCTQGDLRQLLSRPENCCGLLELDVRCIFFDLMNAISHLHRLKITHRDLKPENIVLQFSKERPNGLIYKLIDMGFAKEIDAKSMCASFVGTLQYLAPELLYSKSYSCSVDYWSMGLVMFEVVCGIRPFLPNRSPAQWLMEVEKKPSDIICIYEQSNGDIRCSSEIYPENHISSCFKQHIENWLRISLEYNPKKRGYEIFEPDKINELVIFTKLESLLKKKIISLFSVYNYKFFSYEIEDSTLVSTLQTWIERDTKIEKCDQVLLRPDCENVDYTKYAVQFFDERYPEPMLYVFKKNVIVMDNIYPYLPESVTGLLEEAHKKLSGIHHKIANARGLYFVYKENKLYNTLLKACKLKAIYLLKQFKDANKLCRNMNISLEKLIGQRDLCKEMLLLDTKKYLEYFSQNASHWNTSFEALCSKLSTLMETVIHVTKRYESASKRAALLHTKAVSSYSDTDEHRLNESLEDALECYGKVRQKHRAEKHVVDYCTDMSKVIYNCLMYQKKLISDEDFVLYLQQIVDLEKELEKLLPPINLTLLHIEALKKDLFSDQLTRQTKIWELTVPPKQSSHTDAHLLPQFILGNPSIPKENIGESMSLEKPLHFKLGENVEPSHIRLCKRSLNSAHVKYSSIADQNEEKTMTELNSIDRNGIPKLIDHSYVAGDDISPGVDEVDPTALVKPNFKIGATATSTSDIIRDNLKLRYELMDKTNESFVKYKSILSETLNFDFL